MIVNTSSIFGWRCAANQERLLQPSSRSAVSLNRCARSCVVVVGSPAVSVHPGGVKTNIVRNGTTAGPDANGPTPENNGRGVRGGHGDNGRPGRGDHSPGRRGRQVPHPGGMDARCWTFSVGSPRPIHGGDDEETQAPDQQGASKQRPRPNRRRRPTAARRNGGAPELLDRPEPVLRAAAAPRRTRAAVATNPA